MSSLTSREVHLISRPEGIPVPDNFTMVEVEVPPPEKGEVLVKNIYMSVDPAMRPPMTNGQTKLNSVMGAGAIGMVLESNNDRFEEGTHVQHRSGFREYFVSDGSDLQVVKTQGEAVSTHLHILGGTGLTAYGGLLVTGQLKDAETVFVSAAAGAVGSIVGQIAKIKNCRVVGSCGSDEKVAYLLDELGFDYAVNYKTTSIRRELHIGCPDGIDVYFENVGGDHLDAAVGQMRPLGRIPVCGMISAYHSKGARSEGVTSLANMVYNRVTMRGFVATEFYDIRDQFLADMRKWMSEGKLKYTETILEGIERAPDALIGLFTGLNTGKMLVRLADDV